MKPIAVLIFLLAFYSFGFSQAHTTTVEYKKINHQATQVEVPFPEKIVSGAIEDKMGKMGYKGKDSKGFTVYSGVIMPDLGKESYDLYFMVDRKSRKDKDASTITLLISRGLENFVSDSADATVINNAKKWLDNIKEMIAAYDLEVQIRDQEDIIKKADKKLENLRDDGVDLEKKRKKIEEQIEDNKKDQTKQQAEAEKQRQILETLRSQRKH